MKTINELLLAFFSGDEAEKIIAAEFHGETDEISTAWYMKVLTGVSGWFASLSFLAAVFALIGSDMDEAGILFGIVLCAAAWGINHFSGNKLFARQFALSLCLAGQASATLFFTNGGRSTAAACIFSIILSAVILAAYGYSVARFIAALAAVISVIVLMADHELYNVFSVVILFLAAAEFVLWIHEPDLAAGPVAGISRACAYAFAVSLLALPFLSVENFFERVKIVWAPATIGMAVLFIVLQAKIFTYYRKPLAGPYFAAAAGCTVAFAAVTLDSPGIITALFVTALGFFRGNRILTALAGACLGVYIAAFYYNLSMTLLVKSYILMGSGAILLAAWAALSRWTGSNAS